MMCPVIDNPTSWEICAVICFLHTKNVSVVEMYCESCTVYRQNAMTEETVRQWRGLLKYG
jgi:hypothetical protein